MADITFNQTSYDSSFFHASYSGRRVLVLAPHQDDEINIAGNSIQNFVNAGAEVFVMFSTNGDANMGMYNFTAETRLSEAVNSLRILGVDKEHILIMGYGDTSNNFPGGHIFYSRDKAIKSSRGKTHTYGAAGLQDFSYLTRHEHSRYCRSDYLRDLEELILYVHADIILAVDFDKHSDHRMLSLCFEQVMGRILSRPGNDYRPEVFKRFAYSTAFMAAHDLFADNLPETKKPENVTDKEMIDTSCYSWRGRVRFPVPAGCRNTLLEGNTIAEALKQHVSQDAVLNAVNIINSDEVFFRRRTDSITFSAHVSASSGNPDYAHDFMLANVSDIYSDTPKWTNYLWRPDAEDTLKTITFTWDKEQTISRTVLWGNIDGTPIQKAELRLDNGFSCELGVFPERGLPLVIDIPEGKRNGIKKLSISILDAGGTEGGLAEVEAFAEPEQRGYIRPYLQITCNDNFIYEYNRKQGDEYVNVGCYCWKVNEPVKYEVHGNARLEEGRLIFSDDNDVILLASAGDVYCRSVFRTLSSAELDALHTKQTEEKNHIIKRIKFLVSYFSANE